MSGRKVAFARKPRGNISTSEAKAKENIVRIDATYLDNLKNARMNKNLSDLLGQVNGSVRIELSKEGNSSVSVVSATGEVIADQADIRKAQFLGTFINNERKDILKTETSSSLRKALAALVLSSRTGTTPITSISQAFIANYRGIDGQMKILAANIEQFERVNAETDADINIKNIVLDMGLRIRAAVGTYLNERAHQNHESDPVKLNAQLLADAVPIWFFNRLTAAKIAAGNNDFNLKSFLFPKDPTKGLALTFREARNVNLCSNLLGLLDNMAFGIAVIRNNAFVRAFCGIADDVNLNDAEGLVSKTLQNVPILVAPPRALIDVEDVTSSLAKDGIRGYPWNVGGTVSPQDNLKFLGTLFKRLNILAISRAGLKSAFLANYMPGFIYDPANLELNVFAQLKAAIKARTVTDTTWIGECMSFAVMANRAHRTKMREILVELLGVGPAQTHLYALVETVCGDTDALATTPVCTRITHGETNQLTDSWTPHLIVKRNFVPVDDPVTATLVQVGADKFLSSKQKKEKEMTVDQVRTVLSPAAKRVVALVRAKRYIALSQRLDDWFRSYSSEQFQAAVANSLAAKLDWFLKQPIRYGREDRTAFLDPEEHNVGLENTEDQEEGDEANEADNENLEEEPENPDA